MSAQPQTATPTDESGITQPLADAVRVLRDRKWIVLQALVIIPAVALALTLRQEETYEATASLLFRDSVQTLLPEQNAGPADPTRTAATNDGLIVLPVVAQRTARELGGSITTAEVQASIDVKPSGDTDLGRITASSTSPRLAARIANAYARGYIDFRQDADRAQLRDAVALVERSLALLTPADRAGAQGATLRSRLERLDLARSLQTGNAELVQRATVPEAPSSPSLTRNLLLAFALAALVGFGLAALRERLDRKLRTVEDLEEAYGLPVLGRIPRNRQLAKASERTSLRALDEGADEAFRLLRANLRYYNVDREIRSILVASPESGDGKTTIARMLAMTMASMGDEVVLVETDLHKKATGALADSSLTGLSTVLAGYTELDDALLPPQEGWDPSSEDGEPFTVLPKGPLPPNPSELVDSDRMRSLLKTLEGRFDVVILDTPPLSIISDALSLVPLVSGILVVSSLGRTSREIAQGFRKQLGLLRARPLGLVVNFTVPEENYYYSRSTASAAV